jgi:hypothetical protein
MSTPEQRQHGREYQRRWRATRTPEQKAAECARQAIYRAENREELNRKRRDFMREDRKRNPQKYADRDRKRKTGWSADQYEFIARAQKGLCAVCSNAPGPRGLEADHCHKTGALRMLLCHGCNTALGLLGECPERIQKLKEYVENFNRQNQ